MLVYQRVFLGIGVPGVLKCPQFLGQQPDIPDTNLLSLFKCFDVCDDTEHRRQATCFETTILTTLQSWNFAAVLALFMDNDRDRHLYLSHGTSLSWWHHGEQRPPTHPIALSDHTWPSKLFEGNFMKFQCGTKCTSCMVPNSLTSGGPSNGAPVIRLSTSQYVLLHFFESTPPVQNHGCTPYPNCWGMHSTSTSKDYWHAGQEGYTMVQVCPVIVREASGLSYFDMRDCCATIPSVLISWPAAAYIWRVKFQNHFYQLRMNLLHACAILSKSGFEGVSCFISEETQPPHASAKHPVRCCPPVSPLDCGTCIVIQDGLVWHGFRTLALAFSWASRSVEIIWCYGDLVFR